MLPPSHPTIFSQSRRKTFKACIHHFTWSWYTVVMGTGVVAGLLAHFHFHQPNKALEIATLLFFFLNLIFFVLICGATIARYYMFPEIWPPMLQHPTQSLFIGAFPMGAATLINSAIAAHQSYSFAGPGFLYTLWIFWWLDSIISFLTTVGMLYVIMTKQHHSLDQMSAVWLLPPATLIVASSTGSQLATELISVHTRYAALTSAISFTLLLMGLSLCLMVVTVYLMRLMIHGPLDVSLIFSSFIIVGPLGQAGFSLLVNSRNIDTLHLPSSLNPAAIQSLCFCVAWALWSMGLIWLCIALASVYGVVRKQRVPFALGYWGLIFPNGVYALFTVELGVVLDNPVLNYLGVVFSGFVFLLWGCVFVRTIPAIWDTSVFYSPCASKLEEDSLASFESQVQFSGP